MRFFLFLARDSCWRGRHTRMISQKYVNNNLCNTSREKPGFSASSNVIITFDWQAILLAAFYNVYDRTEIIIVRTAAKSRNRMCKSRKLHRNRFGMENKRWFVIITIKLCRSNRVESTKSWSEILEVGSSTLRCRASLALFLHFTSILYFINMVQNNT